MLPETQQAIEAIRTRESCRFQEAESKFEEAVAEIADVLSESWSMLRGLRRAMRREQAAGDHTVAATLAELEQKLMVIQAGSDKFQRDGERVLAGIRELGTAECRIRADLHLKGHAGVHTEDIGDVIVSRQSLNARHVSKMDTMAEGGAP